METLLQCKKCSGSFKDGKCTKCGSHVAIAKSQFEGDHTFHSRLTGLPVTVHFGKLEEPGQADAAHKDEQE